MKKLLTVGAASVALLAGAAQASTFTTTSGTSEGALPMAVTEVGGIVIDLVGNNGTRVVSQLSASSLFVGFSNSNPFEIGSQMGYDNSVTGALGGGIAELSVRITLFDGDTAPGNFDDSENTLLFNGADIGDFTQVVTRRTDGLGNDLSGDQMGFGDNRLDTGFFTTTDATVLTAIFNSLVSTEKAVFELTDVDPGDNFFDFTQGVDGSLINVGTGPVVTPNPVPVPAAALLFGPVLGAIAMRRRKNK